MSQNNTKIVQSFIQAVKGLVDDVQAADVKAQAIKAKWQALSPDLTGTNLTAAQVTSINTLITDLNTLAGGAVVATIAGKDQPSHDTGALG